MSVIRNDIDLCIGCRRCYEICPMDVFRMNEDLRKAVIVYPEHCVTCGQCYLNCPTGSLGMANFQYGFAVNSVRTVPKNGLFHGAWVRPEPEKEDDGNVP